MGAYFRCDWCMDRGYSTCFKNGSKFSLGEAFKVDCTHCTGKWSDTAMVIDREFREALAWFRTSTPPLKGFVLNKFKTVTDPAKYWENLRTEISSDNIYALERIRDDILKLQEMFGGVEF